MSSYTVTLYKQMNTVVAASQMSHTVHVTNKDSSVVEIDLRREVAACPNYTCMTVLSWKCTRYAVSHVMYCVPNISRIVKIVNGALEFHEWAQPV